MSHRTSPSGAAALLTIQEVADRLHLSTKTIRRMIADGRLPSHRIGRSIREQPGDLAALIHLSRAMPAV